MRITAELLSQAEQRTNPDQQRELVLREYGIPAIENMGVVVAMAGSAAIGGEHGAGGPIGSSNNNNVNDPFDAWDLSNNRLSRLDNFPRLSRLSHLFCAGNLIETIDAKNIAKNVPNLASLTLSYNAISSLAEIINLAQACPKLEFLALTGNPVTRRQHYRLFTIHQIPTLKILDFAKVKPAERDRAQRLAQSAAGAALHSDVQAEARQRRAANGTGTTAKTFEPGDVDDTTGGRSFVTANFTTEQKEQIRQLLINATSAKEVEEIESSVRRGVLPAALQQEQEQQPGNGNQSSSATAANFTSEQTDQIRQLVVKAASTAEVEEIRESVKRGDLPPALQDTEDNNRKRPVEEPVPTLASESNGADSLTTAVDGNSSEPPAKRAKADSG